MLWKMEIKLLYRNEVHCISVHTCLWTLLCIFQFLQFFKAIVVFIVMIMQGITKPIIYWFWSILFWGIWKSADLKVLMILFFSFLLSSLSTYSFKRTFFYSLCSPKIFLLRNTMTFLILFWHVAFYFISFLLVWGLHTLHTECCFQIHLPCIFENVHPGS